MEVTLTNPMSATKLKINLNAITRNWTNLQKLSNSKVITSAVVKANAYGLGVKTIAQHLWQNGVNTFFVSTADEAIEIRKLFPHSVKVLYLNGYSSDEFDAVKEFNILPVLNSAEQLCKFKEHHCNKPAALQIDVGMNRLGLKQTDIINFELIIKSLKIELIIGHLSSADDKCALETPNQLDKFFQLSRTFPGIPRSLAATGGILLGQKYHFDLTRPGIGIYGGYPFENSESVVNLDLPVIQIKEINKNEGVGYNHTFIAGSKRKIAIVSSGYADGLSRGLTNKGFLYSGETECPIIGRVSMDLITVDITNLKTLPQSLQILGAKQTIDDLAKQAGTIGYEILTSLGSRYKRDYYKK